MRQLFALDSLSTSRVIMVSSLLNHRAVGGGEEKKTDFHSEIRQWGDISFPTSGRTRYRWGRRWLGAEGKGLKMERELLCPWQYHLERSSSYLQTFSPGLLIASVPHFLSFLQMFSEITSSLCCSSVAFWAAGILNFLSNTVPGKAGSMPLPFLLCQTGKVRSRLQ